MVAKELGLPYLSSWLGRSKICAKKSMGLIHYENHHDPWDVLITSFHQIGL